MAKRIMSAPLTDDEVEQEIERLRNDPTVKLGRAYQKMQYRKRQYLYTLRNLYNEGARLSASGIDLEMLKMMENQEDLTELNDFE